MRVMKILLALTTCLLAGCATTSETGALSGLGWLSGEWTARDGTISETWVQVSGRTYEGRGVTRNESGEMVETMRLVAMSGDIYFIAKVSHNDLPVAFRLTGTTSTGDYIFENPDHDFPRRIVYTRQADDGLLVTVSDGGTQGFEIRFSRK